MPASGPKVEALFPPGTAVVRGPSWGGSFCTRGEHRNGDGGAGNTGLVSTDTACDEGFLKVDW